MFQSAPTSYKWWTFCLSLPSGASAKVAASTEANNAAATAVAAVAPRHDGSVFEGLLNDKIGRSRGT